MCLSVSIGLTLTALLFYNTESLIILHTNRRIYTPPTVLFYYPKWLWLKTYLSAKFSENVKTRMKILSCFIPVLPLPRFHTEMLTKSYITTPVIEIPCGKGSGKFLTFAWYQSIAHTGPPWTKSFQAGQFTTIPSYESSALAPPRSELALVQQNVLAVIIMNDLG